MRIKQLETNRKKKRAVKKQEQKARSTSNTLRSWERRDSEKRVVRTKEWTRTQFKGSDKKQAIGNEKKEEKMRAAK